MRVFSAIAYWITIAATVMLGLRCTHAEVVKPEHVGLYEGKSIIVTAKGGSEYYFEQGKYSIVEFLGNRLIKREAIEINMLGEFSSRRFVGDLFLDEIESVQIKEMTPGLDGATIALGAISAALLYFFIWGRSGHPWQ